MLLMTFVWLVSCEPKKSGSDSKARRYAESKKTLRDAEQDSPLQFLSVTGSNRHNLIGQTVVRGEIRSTATLVTYQDIHVQLRFLSATGALLEQDEEVVYQTVSPGSAATFKSKYFAPKGTSRVDMKLVSASVVR